MGKNITEKSPLFCDYLEIHIDNQRCNACDFMMIRNNSGKTLKSCLNYREKTHFQ